MSPVGRRTAPVPGPALSLRRVGRKGVLSDAPVRVRGAVDLDLFLADLVADLLLAGDGLLVQADALDRHGFLLDHGALGAQRHLVLLLADGGAVEGTADVGIGDRLALHADLLVRHGHRLGDVLRDDVLAQPGAADLLGAGAHVEALLRAGHGIVRRGAGGVVADGAAGLGATDVAHAFTGGAGGLEAGRLRAVARAATQAVVPVELL